MKSGLFPGAKNERTINKRLDNVIKTGEEKAYCSILTSVEEKAIVCNIKNRQRCLQSMKQSDVEKAVLAVLKLRVAQNKKGGRKHIPSPNMQRMPSYLRIINYSNNKGNTK